MARADISAALAALKRDGVVCYPTETVYGLGVDAESKAALDRLDRLKGRDAAKSYSLLVDGLEMARPLCAPLTGTVLRLADAFWPGPLTLVVPAAPGLDPRLLGAGGGVGLRCSPEPAAEALVRTLRRPITSTSANPSGEPPAQSLEIARGYFGERVAAYVDGGLRSSGFVSTVVEVTGKRARVLREGAIEIAALLAFVDLED